MPITANVERLAAAVPNYIIECAYRAFKRGSVDRIFTLAVGLTRLGYPPLDYLSQVLSDLVSSGRRTDRAKVNLRVNIDGDEVLAISRAAKADGLNKIIEVLSASLGADHGLNFAKPRTHCDKYKSNFVGCLLTFDLYLSAGFEAARGPDENAIVCDS